MKQLKIATENEPAWWDDLKQYVPARTKSKRHMTLRELSARWRFNSGEKNLSQKIDEIVYGIKR